MKPPVVHYRVKSGDRIVAYGCGASGNASSVRTAYANKVTCSACKRTKEWKATARWMTPALVERKAILKWLRSSAWDPSWAGHQTAIAYMIERGEHLSDPSGGKDHG